MSATGTNENETITFKPRDQGHPQGDDYLDRKLRMAVRDLVSYYNEDRLFSMKMEAKMILAISGQMENEKLVSARRI